MIKKICSLSIFSIIVLCGQSAITVKNHNNIINLIESENVSEVVHYLSGKPITQDTKKYLLSYIKEAGRQRAMRAKSQLFVLFDSVKIVLKSIAPLALITCGAITLNALRNEDTMKNSCHTLRKYGYYYSFGNIRLRKESAETMLKIAPITLAGLGFYKFYKIIKNFKPSGLRFLDMLAIEFFVSQLPTTD